MGLFSPKAWIRICASTNTFCCTSSFMTANLNLAGKQVCRRTPLPAHTLHTQALCSVASFYSLGNFTPSHSPRVQNIHLLLTKNTLCWHRRSLVHCYCQNTPGPCTFLLTSTYHYILAVWIWKQNFYSVERYFRSTNGMLFPIPSYQLQSHSAALQFSTQLQVRSRKFQICRVQRVHVLSNKKVTCARSRWTVWPLGEWKGVMLHDASERWEKTCGALLVCAVHAGCKRRVTATGLPDKIKLKGGRSVALPVLVHIPMWALCGNNPI